MENEPELIRDQMQETRTALTEKLEALEQQVSNTVHTATSTVTETVQTVKEAVQDTVGTVQETVSSVKETVKETFDLPGHVQRHPWMAMAGSVAVGYLAGRLIHTGEQWETGARPMAALTHPEPRPTHNGANGASKGESKERKEDAGEGWMQSLLGGFSGELDKLKDLGLGVMMAVVRDLTTRSIPGEIGSRVETWMNDVTRKMGVAPIQEHVLSEPQPEPAPSLSREPSPEKGDAGARKQRVAQQPRSRR
jgi:ElaB/YqjD/DUF883 family membrane-anchored ribosome-binding protein